MSNIVSDTRARLRALTGRKVSQADLGAALGLTEKNADRTVRRWEEDGPTGPAEVALAYMRQGMILDFPAHVIADTGAEGRDFIIRLRWPRFIATIVSAEEDAGEEWAWIEPGVERLALVQWIDPPLFGVDREALLRDAAIFAQEVTLDSLEE